MDKEIPFEDLVDRAKEKIELGYELISQLEEFRQINGVDKIQRKISQEVKFLQKVNNMDHFRFAVNHLN